MNEHRFIVERNVHQDGRARCACGWAGPWHEPLYEALHGEPLDNSPARLAKVDWRTHVRDADAAAAPSMGDLLRRQTGGTMAQAMPGADEGRSTPRRRPADQGALW